MPRWRVCLYLLPAGLVWLIDRVVKNWALETLDFNSTVDVWGRWLGWTLHRNTGAAFGLGAHDPHSLTFVAWALTILLAAWWIWSIWWLEKTESAGIAAGAKSRWEPLAISFILGGSAGNLTDRMRHGAVIDFIDFKIWPIFNVADVAITCGAVLWAASVIFSGGKGTRR